MRAFLALPALPPAREQLGSLCERLRVTVAEVRWAPIETVHITLHFFGQVSDESAAGAVHALGPVFAVQAPLLLRVNGLGAFPSESRPRVLWCGVDGDVDALRDLGRRCASVLASAGFPVEQRAFRPHCTLGRPRIPWPESARRRWSELASQPHSTAPFTADVAILYESVSGPGGARHLPRTTLPLRG